MATILFARASSFQERLAIPLVVVPLVVYIAMWNWEPYAYGFSVLILAPVQLFWGAVGLVFLTMRLSKRVISISVIVNTALVASAIMAFLALKSINWA